MIENLHEGNRLRKINLPSCALVSIFHLMHCHIKLCHWLVCQHWLNYILTCLWQHIPSLILYQDFLLITATRILDPCQLTIWIGLITKLVLKVFKAFLAPFWISILSTTSCKWGAVCYRNVDFPIREKGKNIYQISTTIML